MNILKAIKKGDNILKEHGIKSHKLDSEILMSQVFGKNRIDIILNFDMNLTNIIYNQESDKLSFIDFDKVAINSHKVNSQNYSSRVIGKFRDSLKKYDLFAKFDWDKFIRSVYG